MNTTYQQTQIEKFCKSRGSDQLNDGLTYNINLHPILGKALISLYYKKLRFEAICINTFVTSNTMRQDYNHKRAFERFLYDAIFVELSLVLELNCSDANFLIFASHAIIRNTPAKKNNRRREIFIASCNILKIYFKSGGTLWKTTVISIHSLMKSKTK